MKAKWILAGLLILAMSFILGCPGADDTKPVKKGPWTVTFNTDGGVAVPSQSVNHNGKVTPVTTTKDGYSFTGWYKESSCTNMWYFESDTVTKKITLYAEWQQVPQGFFNVGFITNGGSPVIIDQVIAGGGSVVEPSDPTKDGFFFAGWYSDAALTQEWVFYLNTVTQNTTLYAKWNTAFTVTFNSNGGTAVEKQVVPDGGKLEPVVSTKANFRLTGWYKEAALTNVWDFNTGLVTGNMTLYAKWESLVPATVTFVTNTPEITVEPLSTNIGDKIKRPRVTVRDDGKACTGWYKDPGLTNEFDFLTDTVGQAGMTLYADWGTAVNVWFSSNHYDGGHFQGQLNQGWDNGTNNLGEYAATTDVERKFLQRKDGTHYIDLSCADDNPYYFRFWIEGTIAGNTMEGRFHPDDHNMQVIYNNPMPLPYDDDMSVEGRSWGFRSDGDFVIILNAVDPNNRYFILTQPYTVSNVLVSPASYTRDTGTAFTYKYNATVTGTNPPFAVTWSLTGATGGTTIDQTGLVSVTAGETAKTMTVRATSQAVPAIFGTATLKLQAPSSTPVVYDITVEPAAATVMKAVNADGTPQLHNGLPAEQYRGRQFTANGIASGGASEDVTYSIVETGLKPGTKITSDGYLTIALNEEKTSLTVRVASAEPGFTDVHVDVPVTVQSFSVWLVGGSTTWGRGSAYKMTDNGNGTYTWTGAFTNANASQGISFDTDKSNGGNGGDCGWQADAWYCFTTTQTFGAGEFAMRTNNDQANMFGIDDDVLGTTYTILLDVTVPKVTVTAAP
jgi:uncharacterized repeat protein (TIGR02543 family)